MKRENVKWKSPSLGKEMEMLIYGERGTPVLIFPSEEGDCYEWEQTGIVDSLIEQISEGYNQLFCVNSVLEESLLNKKVDPYVRISRQKQYENYICDEVISQIKKRNKNSHLLTAGANLGAYHALLYGLKHPTDIDKVIAISGCYDVKPYLDGFYDDNVYFNNPTDFIPNLNDQKLLKAIDAMDIRILTYDNDPQKGSSQRMSDTLWLKNLEHEFYIWDERVSDPWELVGPMLKEHLF